MRIKSAVAALIIVMLSVSAPLAREVKTLTLEECVLSAVENNLNVAVQILNPRLSELSVALANEKFLPQLSFDYETQNTTEASYSWVDATGDLITDLKQYTALLTQEVPTGGTLSIQFYSYDQDTNRNLQTINPLYYGSLAFQFEQPLLKDFGFKMSRREILIARTNRDISEQQFKSTLLQTIYDVESAYWNLVFSIEDLKVRQRSLELARDLLRKNQREVEVGTLAPIEILTAQAEVAAREADILQAEVLVRNNEDALKTVINQYAKREEAGIQIVPNDEPTVLQRAVDIDAALSTALEYRPDLERYRLDIKNRQLDLSYAKNQMLPDLSLTASYWSPAISGTRILYQDDDPLTGVVVGSVPGKFSDIFKEIFDFKYKNWSVGVTFTIPFHTLLSRAQYAQARVGLDQAVNSLRYQEQQIFLEIRNAVRTAETNFKRISAYQIARKLAEERLDAEVKKLKVGLSTNYIVLQMQRDLATAHSNELRAVIDYNLSLADLDRVQGISLDRKNIKLTY
jgi:outer membrane protein TolC